MKRSHRILAALSLAVAATLAAATHGVAHAPTSASIDELSRQIADRPDRSELYLARGELRRVAGDVAGARADLATVERLDPGHPELRVARAALALDSGDPATARGWLDEALAARPADARALRLRARSLVDLGDRHAAIADLGVAITLLDRPHPDLFLERARLQVAVGDHAGARGGLKEARDRLGPVVNLERFASELDRADGGRERMAEPRLTGGAGGRAGSAPRLAHREASGVTAHAATALIPTVTRGPYLQVGTPDAVTLRWRTSGPADSRVRYGIVLGALRASTTDSTLTAEHEVRITGLSPSTRYYYSVGTSTDVLAGDASFTFQTAPEPGSTGPVRAWIIGDSGSPTSAAFAVRDAYAAWTGPRGTDLWLMLGDNAYSAGTDSEYQEGVFDQYPLMLRQCVLWPTRGNHDELHGGANNDYYDIFTMPAAGEAGGLASGTEAYYSFDRANIHFICLDSEGSDRTPGSAMLTWLAADLAANTHPWVIAYWHHPPYSKGSHNSDSDSHLQEMRENVLPILEAGGVDLVLTGHSHSYERSFLLDGHYGHSSTLAAPMVVDGGDGRPDGSGPYQKPAPPQTPHAGAVYAVAGSSSSTGGGPLNHPVMVSSIKLCGSMVLDVAGDRLDARFLSLTGAVLDSFSIVKITEVVGTGDAPPAAHGVRLGPGVPNPFTLDLEMTFSLERAGHVRLDVHDASGRLVATIVDGWREAGTHPARWDGRDAHGHALANGVYFAVLNVDGDRVSRKIARVR